MTPALYCSFIQELKSETEKKYKRPAPINSKRSLTGKTLFWAAAWHYNDTFAIEQKTNEIVKTSEARSM